MNICHFLEGLELTSSPVAHASSSQVDADQHDGRAGDDRREDATEVAEGDKREDNRNDCAECGCAQHLAVSLGKGIALTLHHGKGE